ncbi:MAG: glucuronate isomerase [Clostridia bacterium]|nr:glucuronate isomerase [Clostridia bacterium]
MKEFLGKDFLLSTETAKKLYHSYAAEMPIIDYHCHINPKEIYENKQFSNIFEVWLAGDHYKWRLMRSNGVDERYITGDAPEREKFQKFAEALPKAIGNPMYHWCHMELKKYFGYNGVLNGETAEEVWQLAKEKLSLPSMSVRGIIAQSNVAFIGTTDDPVDTLEWHKKIAEDSTFKTKVAPTFRPDKALNIDKAGWADYLAQLSQVANISIKGITDLKNALNKRIDFFDLHGCRASDHGLDYIVYVPKSEKECDKIMKKALKGKKIAQSDADAFKTNLLQFCATEYHKKGWAMQLHYNCLRNTNTNMFEKLGPDTGFDCMGQTESGIRLTQLLDSLEKENSLPKTIIYSLYDSDNSFIDTVLGAFQGTEIAGKIQHGSAWWFNDNKVGMQEQLISLANLSLLGNFVGMLTDSRSFLSYTRHEYFRRILCELIGDLVENGEYPADEKTLSKITQDICFYNAQRYFGLEEK